MKANSLILWFTFWSMNVVMANTLYRSSSSEFYEDETHSLQPRTSHMKKRSLMDIEIYDDNENECFSIQKVWFNGSCHAIGSMGPCGKNEILYLTKPKENEPLKPFCQPKKCTGSNQIWWPSLERCEQKSNLKLDYCNMENKLIHVNAFGDAVCECIPSNGKMKDREDCFEYYQRGPCRSNEVVTFDTKTGYAVCSPDLCLELNQRSKPALDTLKTKIYAPLEGTGPCYKLKMSEPCSIAGENSRFVVDDFAHVPRCSLDIRSLKVIGGPLTCRVGSDNKCREEVIVKREDRMVYIQSLVVQLKEAKP